MQNFQIHVHKTVKTVNGIGERLAQRFEFSLVVLKVLGSNPGWGKLAEIFPLGKEMSEIDWQHL